MQLSGGEIIPAGMQPYESGKSSIIPVLLYVYFSQLTRLKIFILRCRKNTQTSVERDATNINDDCYALSDSEELPPEDSTLSPHFRRSFEGRPSTSNRPALSTNVCH